MKPSYKVGQKISLEFTNGKKVFGNITKMHFNHIYGEWVCFIDSLGKNVLESNIMAVL